MIPGATVPKLTVGRRYRIIIERDGILITYNGILAAVEGHRIRLRDVASTTAGREPAWAGSQWFYTISPALQSVTPIR